MKKTFFISIVVAMSMSMGVSAQENYSSPTAGLEKHQFGFGVGTTLLDNVGSFNQFLNTVGYSGSFNLHTVQSSLFTVHFDYQYRFNDSWSIEARLVYKHRHIIQHMTFVSDGCYGLIGSLNSVYRDIAIPVTANFRWVTRSGSSFELFAGAGLTTLGLSVKSPATLGFNDMENTRFDIGIEYDRSIDVYGVVGFQFEIPYGAFALKPFVSLSYSPMNNSRYTVTPLQATSAIPGTKTSTPMHLCELQCGITVQF
ncbi:MAG: outer membrane beta-barrel protein [Prevotellaceae bacterium]|nr:outer membrane beta-barrel protein [Candidatus Colimorpha pelethequi]MBQ0088631.1 outer membrane beta-barrel protein [Candidatus Faecinaster equi]